jgi:hypothetical protein
MPAADDDDLPSQRQRYVGLQLAMQTAIEPLRDRLRTALARLSPQMSRLASLDAVMGTALAARERELLGLMPTLLEQHFERLRRASQDPTASDWHAEFRQDMQRLLLAELELRLQPLQGLLNALRSQPQGAS